MSFSIKPRPNSSNILTYNCSGKKNIVDMLSSSTSNNDLHCISMSTSTNNTTQDESRDVKDSHRTVTFHPIIVTDVYFRPSVSEEEKSNLFFTSKELKQCRHEERSQMIARLDKMSMMLQGQLKYGRYEDGQKREPTTITRVSM
jgi:hypothetical protein